MAGKPRFGAAQLPERGLLVSGVALTFTRSLSPLFLVGILVLAARTVRRGSLGSLVAVRRLRVVAAALVVAAVVSSALVVFVALTLVALAATPYDPAVPSAARDPEPATAPSTPTTEGATP